MFFHFVVFGKDATDLVDGMAGEAGRGLLRDLSDSYLAAHRFCGLYAATNGSLGHVCGLYGDDCCAGSGARAAGGTTDDPVR